MATNFPTSMQDLDATRGTSGQSMDSPNHATHHNTEDDTIEALQTKVGIDSSADTNSLDYKVSNAASVDPGHLHNIASANDMNTAAQADGYFISWDDGAGEHIYSSTTAPDASTSVKGVAKMSVAPASATNPIAVGDNDPRVPIQGENDALIGTSGTPSSSNKYVTADDVSDVAGSGKIVRASGTALPALDGSTLLNIPAKQHLFTSNVTFSNTTTETTIATFTLAANELSTANVVKIRIPVTDFGLQSAASDTFTLRLKYGATTVASVAFVNHGSNFHNGFGVIEGTLVGAGTTSSQEGSIVFSATSTAAGVAIGGGGTGTATEDSTGALTVAVTGQFSVANANSDFTSPHGYAEIIK